MLINVMGLSFFSCWYMYMHVNSAFLCVRVFVPPNKATHTITVHSFHPSKLKSVATGCYTNLHQAKLVWLTVNTADCAVG